jgi:UDP-2,3-diacylglucosamine pyrophosphatase LpxH
LEKTVIVISDLHVGKRDRFDIFASRDKYSLFDTFLVYCKQLSGQVELVIDGDFVDFLQLEPWNDTSRPTALRKIKEIVAGSEEVFSSLGTFLHQSRHELTILLGNHDVELAYPEVGRELIQAIIKFAPEAKDRILLFDKRITYNPGVNGVLIHIEHGNAGDPWNAINYNSIFHDAGINTKSFDYPPGTTFVYEVMNAFKEKFRFVDLLKPEVPAVPLLLLALKPLMTSKFIPNALGGLLDALANCFLSRLREQIGGFALKPARPKPISAVDQLAAELASECLSGSDLENSQIDLLKQYLFGSGAVPATPSASLGRHPQQFKIRLALWALKGLARFKTVEGADYYSQDHPANPAAKGARSRLLGDVQVVVFGHTHEALKTEFCEGLYVNSGTWANLIEMPEAKTEALLAWVEMLSNNSFEVTANPTFVQIEPNREGVAVSLRSWGQVGPRTLWTKSVSAKGAS